MYFSIYAFSCTSLFLFKFISTFAIGNNHGGIIPIATDGPNTRSLIFIHFKTPSWIYFIFPTVFKYSLSLMFLFTAFQSMTDIFDFFLYLVVILLLLSLRHYLEYVEVPQYIFCSVYYTKMCLSIDILIIVVLSAPHSHHDIALIKLITVLLLFSIIFICVLHVCLLKP